MLILSALLLCLAANASASSTAAIPCVARLIDFQPPTGITVTSEVRRSMVQLGIELFEIAQALRQPLARPLPQRVGPLHWFIGQTPRMRFIELLYQPDGDTFHIEKITLASVVARGAYVTKSGLRWENPEDLIIPISRGPLFGQNVRFAPGVLSRVLADYVTAAQVTQVLEDAPGLVWDRNSFDHDERRWAVGPVGRGRFINVSVVLKEDAVVVISAVDTGESTHRHYLNLWNRFHGEPKGGSIVPIYR